MRTPHPTPARGRRREPRRYVLDTSAVIAYLADEAGAQDVTALLRRAERGQVELQLSFMSLMELEYNALRAAISSPPKLSPPPRAEWDRF